MLGGALAAALVIAMIGCGGDPPPAAQVPPPPDDAAVSAHIGDLFHALNPTPGLAFRVDGLESSAIPGWRRGRLVATLGTERQEMEFQLSADGRYLVRGEVMDLSLDPAAAVMARVRLDGRPVRGPASAPVTIVEWASFEDAASIEAYRPLEDEILGRLGDRVRFVYKHLPRGRFHLWAEPAAIAAACAFRQGNAHFWAFYRSFYEAKGAIDSTNLTAKAVALATAEGMDFERLRACLEGKETLAEVQADVDEAASLGIATTPSFLVDGRRFAGADSVPAIAASVDAALAPAAARPRS